MKPFVRIAALLLAAMFLTGAGLAWFDVLTHENVLTNPELKIAGGWLMTGLMFARPGNPRLAPAPGANHSGKNPVRKTKFG